MKIKIPGISPIVAILLILSLLVPVGISMAPSAPAMALADNVTITGIGTNGVFTATTHPGGSVAIYFTVGVNCSSSSGTIDGDIYLYSNDGSTLLNQVTFAYPTSVSPCTVTSLSYNLAIPSSIPSSATTYYAVKVDARQPAGSGTPTPSTLLSNALTVFTHTPAQAVQLSPVNGTCITSNSPLFQWNANVETGYTFTYELQYATNSSFTSAYDNSTINDIKYQSSGLSKTLYYWRVRAIDQYGNPGSWSSTWTVCIDTDTVSAPTLADITPPTGSYNPTYSWSAVSSDTSTCANIQYTVGTYTEPGHVLIDLATVSSTTYTRNVLFTPGTTYHVYVQAHNCAGTTSTWAGPKDFTMAPAPVTTYNIPLSVGWNLISLPLIPTTTTISSILSTAGISNYVYRIDYYSYGTNCGSPGWVDYCPSANLYSLTTMEDGKAYWIQTTQACNLTGTGTATPSGGLSVPSQYNLCYFPGDNSGSGHSAQGWNMLGFKSENITLKASEYLAGVSGKYGAIYRYAGGFATVNPATDYLTPGTGYWINMISSGSITPPSY